MKEKSLLVLIIALFSCATIKAQTDLDELGEDAFRYFTNSNDSIKELLISEDQFLELSRKINNNIDLQTARKNYAKELERFEKELERTYSNGSSQGVQWASVTELMIESETKEVKLKNSNSLDISSINCHFCSNGIEGELTFDDIFRVKEVPRLGMRLRLTISANKPISLDDLVQDLELDTKYGFYKISENSEGVEMKRHASNQKLILTSDRLLTPRRIKSLEIIRSKKSSTVDLKLSLDKKGTKIWYEFTKDNSFKEVAFVFNGLVLKTSRILSIIENGEISLNFSVCSLEALNVIIYEITKQN